MASKNIPVITKKEMDQWVTEMTTRIDALIGVHQAICKCSDDDPCKVLREQCKQSYDFYLKGKGIEIDNPEVAFAYNFYIEQSVEEIFKDLKSKKTMDNEEQKKKKNN